MAKGIQVTHCRDCPFRTTTNHYSTDGWDHMEDWMCTKMVPAKKIQGAVEWHEESKIELPAWCPLPEIKE